MTKHAHSGLVISVLLDRDGTIIEDKHYLADPAGVELLPGAAEGLRMLSRAGLELFVVTNQSGIGRGYFSEAEYHACHAAMEDLLRDRKVPLSGSAFCPHAPEDDCDCRKPSLGMWRALASRHGLDPSRTAMVGDKVEDIAFGRNAGMGATVLVLTGKGGETAARLQLPLPDLERGYRPVDATRNGAFPHAVAKDLPGAAAFILSLGST
ncbi:MAG: HAD family hydrolase [Deltaproteobacteria bacterium]|nr:HAD family hydrolase [Deltaproteobacteria bacterium]